MKEILRRQCTITLLSPLLAVGCGGAEMEGEELGRSQEGLRNGVVMHNNAPLDGIARLDILESNTTNDYSHCSAQVISKRTLLTAAHCFQYSSVQSTSGSTKVRSAKTINSSGAGVWLSKNGANGEIASIKIHPNYYTNTGFNYEYDIAVVNFSHDLYNTVQADAAPMLNMWRTSPFDAWANGYGYYDDNQVDWLLRSGVIEDVVYSLGMYRGYTPPGTPQLCTGDSGGPLKVPYFGTGLVLGVASYNDDGGPHCGDHTAAWAPVVRDVAWIANNLTGSCNVSGFASEIVTCW